MANQQQEELLDIVEFSDGNDGEVEAVAKTSAADDTLGALGSETDRRRRRRRRYSRRRRGSRRRRYRRRRRSAAYDGK